MNILIVHWVHDTLAIIKKDSHPTIYKYHYQAYVTALTAQAEDEERERVKLQKQRTRQNTIMQNNLARTEELEQKNRKHYAHILELQREIKQLKAQLYTQHEMENRKHYNSAKKHKEIITEDIPPPEEPLLKETIKTTLEPL